MVEKTSKKNNAPLYYVAIGGSAEGLEAIQAFFDHMPDNTGLAFIVMQSLSSDVKSLVAQLLKKNNAMNVHTVTERIRVEANSIYVIPPKQTMRIEKGHLCLGEQTLDPTVKLPMDIFFESLANDCAERAIGILLSGRGRDGAKGLVQISHSKGLTIAENPETAHFDEMPSNAIATKKIDCVLDVKKMPAIILDYIKEASAFREKNVNSDSTLKVEEQYKIAVEAAPYAMLLIDTEGIINFIKQSATEMLGYEKEQLFGEPIETLLPKSARSRHKKYRHNYMQNPKSRLMGAGIQTFALTANDEEIPVEVRLNPIESNNGIQILCSIEDISIRIQAEEILQRSTEKLEIAVHERTIALSESNKLLEKSKNEYISLYEEAPDLYATFSIEDGIIIKCNKTFVTALKYSDKNQLLGKNIFELYSDSTKAKARDCINTSPDKNEQLSTELILMKRDGSELPVSFNYRVIPGANTGHLFASASWRDITNENLLKIERQQYMELDLLYRVTQVVSESKHIDVALQSVINLTCEITGWKAGHAYLFNKLDETYFSSNIWYLADNRLNEMKDLTLKNKSSDLNALPAQVLDKKKAIVMDATDTPQKQLYQALKIQSILGFPVYKENEIIVIFEFFSSEKEVDNTRYKDIFSIISEQISHVFERMEVQEQHAFLARYDAITQIPNRHYFQDILSEAIQKHQKDRSGFSLLYIDIDNFKNINDSLGHHVGDLYLKKIACLLQANSPPDAKIARIGGDEFTIILDNIQSPHLIRNIVKHLLRQFIEPQHVDGNQIHTTISIGISIYPDGGDNVETLLKHADVAMYKAKELGKNQLQFYSEELNAVYQRHIFIENQLRHAIRHNELYITFHPIMDLNNNKPYGAETLLRWKNKTLGFISPTEFISIAEDTGLISEIGLWVLDKALSQCQTALKKTNKNG